MQGSHAGALKNKLGASTLKVDDFIPQYSEGVARFLRDNSLSMGEQWVRKTERRLYNFCGKNEEGDDLGSSTIVLAAISNFCPGIPLITGQQLFDLYTRTGNKNPFGKVYIDFGVQVNGEPDINTNFAKALLESYKLNGINPKEIVVPNFAQLTPIADKEVGLVLKLKDGVKQSDLVSAYDYPFEGRFGKNGFFRACLLRDGDWCTNDAYLDNFDEDGRMVCYDVEGTDPSNCS